MIVIVGSSGVNYAGFLLQSKTLIKTSMDNQGVCFHEDLLDKQIKISQAAVSQWVLLVYV